MAMGIDFGFEGNPLIVAAEMMGFAARVSSFKEPLKKAVQKVVIPSIAMNFEHGGRPDTWEPLAESTMIWRGYEGDPSGRPLLNTGTLAAAAQQLNVWDITSDTAQIKSLPERAAYGAVQDEGMETAVRSIPARPFLLIQDEDQDAIVELFGDWLVEKSGFNDDIITGLI